MSGIIGKREVRGSGVVSKHANIASDIDHDSLANFAANEHYTQANITALGTVTSGNISHADIVFPDGHVIQTQTNSITTSVENSSGSSASPSWTDVISKAITPASGTKIIVCCSFLIGSNTTTGFAMWRILRDSAVINVSTDTSAVQWISEATPHNYVCNFNGTSIVDLHGADGSTEVTYKLQLARQTSAHNSYIGRGFAGNTGADGASAATHITLFEIQT